MTERPIRYAVSREFDYGKQIAPDAGPATADDYDWECVPLAEETLAGDGPLVVDNRLTPGETAWLEATLVRTRRPLYLRIVDTLREAQDHWWYAFLRRAVASRRVALVHAYAPRELLADLLAGSPHDAHVFAPYPYRRERELDPAHARRRNAILLSGVQDGNVYPLRHHFWLGTRRSPLWRPFTRVLRHPGYPDIGQPQVHHVVGDAYVREIARHRYAFVCAARNGCELLKYREIAYAGSCPVGELPPSLADCPDDAFVTYDRRNLHLFRRTILSSNAEATARRFRTYLARARERGALVRRVADEIRSGHQRMAADPGRS